MGRFLELLETDFLVDRSDGIFDFLDTFWDDFMVMDQNGVPPPLMARLRNEHLNLRKLLTRIKVIVNTSFAPGVHAALRLIVGTFTTVLLLVKFESGPLGILLVGFYFFLLSSLS